MPESSVPFIDILCKVVDNYGDIGVVYRLARALSALEDPPSIRLVVDDLEAFRALEPLVDPGKEAQTARGWTIVRWSTPWEGFRERRPRVVVEPFACGRPDWLEELLFDPLDPRTRYIVNLEHLTAESWVGDFHRMTSATRSGLVKKYLFMPGFTDRTGGLILDPSWVAACGRIRKPGGENRERLAILDMIGKTGHTARGKTPFDPGFLSYCYWIIVFSYEHDYSGIVTEIARFNGDRPVLVLSAAGRSQGSFLEAWERIGMPFPTIKLPFLSQETWDTLILAADFNIVRGEDSLARAALSGKPFLWHAYAQDENHQLVKVRALLDRLEPHLEPGAFEALSTLSRAFNDRSADGPEPGSEGCFLFLLRRSAAMKPGFRALSAELEANGDLAANLVTFIREIVYTAASQR